LTRNDTFGATVPTTVLYVGQYIYLFV